MTGHLDSSLSSLSNNDSPTQIEDWDRSLIISDVESSSCPLSQPPSKETPRNSIVFPVDSDTTPGRTRAITMEGSTRGERSLSELLRLHAQKGTDVKYSAEEALQVAEVLGQWVSCVLLDSFISDPFAESYPLLSPFFFYCCLNASHSSIHARSMHPRRRMRVKTTFLPDPTTIC